MYPILIYPDFKLSAKIPRTPKREAWREGGGPAAVRSAPRAPWPVRGAAPNRGTGRAQRERPPARLTQSGCAARGRAHPMRGASSASIQEYNSYIESRVSACLYTCTVLPVFPLKLNISRPLPEFVKSIRGFEAGRRSTACCQAHHRSVLRQEAEVVSILLCQLDQICAQRPVRVRIEPPHIQ